MIKTRPDIIVYAGSGYGRSGPNKARPAYAEFVESYDGSTCLNGYPGGGPATVGVSPWTDATQAMHGLEEFLMNDLARFGPGLLI